MLFKEIVGQAELKKNLIKVVNSNRLGHALLFNGNYGYGGLALALGLAQYLFCAEKGEVDSCGTCPSCLKVQKLAHPDLHFTFPINSSDSTKVISSDDFLDSWREMVQSSPYFDLKQWNELIGLEKKQSLIKVEESKKIIKKLSLKSYEANYKILVVWGAEKMNTEAANRLLKLIEEPTERTLIILLTENEEMILRTITSRTQILRVPPIEQEKLSKYLENEEELNQSYSAQISRQSEGNLIRAKSLIQTQEEDEIFFRLFTEWMRACYEANVERIYKWVEEMSSVSYGREKQKRFLQYALNLMREGILRNYNGNQLQSYFGKEDEFMKKFSPFIIAENIIEINELLNEAHYHIERNGYAKIIFMDMSMQFANLLRAKKRKFVS